MPDFLPAVELAAKTIRPAVELAAKTIRSARRMRPCRSTLAYIGAAIDCGLPMRISQSSPAASAAAETSPEAVSARTESAAPASGYPTGPHDDDRPVGGCYFCGQPTANVLATDYDDGEFVCPPCADLTTSAGPPAAGDDPAGTPPPAGSPLTWGTWAIPAITDVLSEHSPEEHRYGPVLCHDSDGIIHAEFADWQGWRDHVAPLLGECTNPFRDYLQRAVQGDALQDMAEADERVVTRLDSWKTEVGFASEVFPQHQKYPK